VNASSLARPVTGANAGPGRSFGVLRELDSSSGGMIAWPAGSRACDSPGDRPACRRPAPRRLGDGGARPGQRGGSPDEEVVAAGERKGETAQCYPCPAAAPRELVAGSRIRGHQWLARSRFPGSLPARRSGISAPTRPAGRPTGGPGAPPRRVAVRRAPSRESRSGTCSADRSASVSGSAETTCGRCVSDQVRRLPVTRSARSGRRDTTRGG
jgi:hypothetical protein